MIAHNVFFTLHDQSEEARHKLVEQCRIYLTAHPGLISFACGVMDPSFNRPVNDQNFDVSLHMVFGSRADHDIYQDAPRHMKFVDGNKASWATVRVFDSEVETG